MVIFGVYAARCSIGLAHFLRRSSNHFGGKFLGAGLLVASLVGWPALAQNSAGHPDFAGRWQRNAMDPELPRSGPGPLVNLRRPMDDHTPNGGGDPLPLVGDYNNPILRPQAAEVVKKAGELSLGGRINPDPSNQCQPFSPPYAFTIQLGVQFVWHGDELLMFYPQDDQVRHVRMNSSHPAKVTPSAMGDSVAHYEGDTLVIDTIGVRLSRVSMVDRYGTPQSKAMHLVERYRLIDLNEAKEALAYHVRRAGPAGAFPADPKSDKGLRLTYTVEDPEVFNMPWTADITYLRSLQGWSEQICAENIVEYWPGMNIAIPKADKPEF
jgi:hypothetical protein